MARKRYPRMDFDQPKRRSGMLPWLLMVLLGLLGYLGYRTYQSAPAVPAPAAEAPRTVRDLPLPEQASPGQPATGAVPELGALETAASKLVPAQALPQAAPGLPALEQSDDWFRRQASGLSGDNRYQAWLRNEQLLRKLALLIGGMAEGQLPPRLRSALPRLDQPFAAKPAGADGTRYHLDPAGFRRYQSLVAAFAALDEGAVADLYRHCRPLLEAAYAELGHAGRSVDGDLTAAMDRLLAAQPPKGAIELTRPGVLYQYADPALEKLTPVEKQLIRMGPDNAAILQNKVRRLRAALQQPPEPAAKPTAGGIPLPLPPAMPLPNP